MVDTKRHNEIFRADRFSSPVHIVGCGGMGSRVAEGLVRMGVGRMGCPIFLYDDDTFEAHNIANQYVTSAYVGKPKVAALREQLLAIEPDLYVQAHVVNIIEHVPLPGIVFLCLDTMAARRTIMETCLENNAAVACVIETRMDAEVGISHCFNPSNKKHQDCWWLYWHPDGEAENIAGCSGPQSIISAIYGTTMLALKQFEQFARTKTTHGKVNRVYQDFENGEVSNEVWPT